MDAWERISILVLIKTGKKFDMSHYGVFKKIGREIEIINSQRAAVSGPLYEQDDTDDF